MPVNDAVCCLHLAKAIKLSTAGFTSCTILHLVAPYCTMFRQPAGDALLQHLELSLQIDLLEFAGVAQDMQAAI